MMRISYALAAAADGPRDEVPVWTIADIVVQAIGRADRY
jgi:hypothetical protein